MDVRSAPPRPPDPALWQRPDLRAAIARHDFPTVYVALNAAGLSQSRIGALTGQKQPEVSAIMHGRRITAFAVIARTVHGLGIPPCYAGPSCQQCPAHRGEHITPRGEGERPVTGRCGLCDGTGVAFGADQVEWCPCETGRRYAAETAARLEGTVPPWWPPEATRPVPEPRRRRVPPLNPGVG